MAGMDEACLAFATGSGRDAWAMWRNMILALGALVLTGADRPRDFVVRGDGVVPAQIGGRPARLLLSPWAPAAPTLNPGFVRAIGLHAGLFGFAVKVGPVKVRGDTSVTRLDYSGASGRRRVVWFERDYAQNADAAVGPGGMPAEVIRFELRPPKGDERVTVLPLVQNMFRPSYARVMLGKRPIILLFDPQHSRSLATAGAGAALAEFLGGALQGPPRPAPVAFGIMRPARTLRFGRPLQFGNIRLDEVLVRISDNGSVAGVKDDDADPEEVVVSAKSKSERRDVVIIGQDVLGSCASFTFDKPARQIRLACA